MQTIVELPEFQKLSKALLSNSERMAIIDFLALHPDSGVLIRGTGGIRKLRWAAKTKGKSGGFRVIYYYHNNSLPLFLLTIYSKNDIQNLPESERNELSRSVKILLSKYRKPNE